MTAPDWHAHAEQAARLAPATTPALSLILPGPAAPAAPAELPDSRDTALAAQVAEELAVLTRVLLGLDPEAASAPLPALDEVVALVDPEPAYVAPVSIPEPVVEAFVAPPVVEVAPLVPEPAVEPEPEQRRRNLIDELRFLDG
jgi:hypothetical protein